MADEIRNVARRKEAAKGHPDRSGKRRRIAVTFDPQMFGEIDGLAERSRQSFGATVRDLCEMSLGAVRLGETLKAIAKEGGPE